MEPHKVNGHLVIDNFTIEWEQGVVVRRNGSLAADFANGKWEWVNPKLGISDQELENLFQFCVEFEKEHAPVV